ncbi:MAG: S8 family peptidase [Pseudothermotoga sp.]|nr:S8 family peptidase [Pseudothermotoga sp.]
MRKYFFLFFTVLMVFLLTNCGAPTLIPQPPTSFSAKIVGKVSAYVGDVTRSFDAVRFVPSENLNTADRIEDQYVVHFDAEKVPLNVKEELQKLGVVLDELRFEKEVFYLLRTELNIPRLKEILSLIPGFLNIEPNCTVSLHSRIVPNDTYYNWQWNLTMVNLPYAWSYTIGTDIVTIAVIDSGVDFSHEDLSGIFVEGYDFVENDNYPQDENGHGTHVAGIIAALTNNYRGVAGVTWGQAVKIMPLKIVGSSGNGTVFDFAKAVVYAVNHGAKIINVSLGTSRPSNLSQDVVRYAYQNDVVMVCAAGNDDGPVGYPAAYPETIAVGAVTQSVMRASYSNYGPELDVVAPGGDEQGGILSTYPSYLYPYVKYIGMAGTSMAAPHVTGLVALMISQGIVGVENIRTVLRRTAIDLGSSGYDIYYGAGLINAYAAVTWQGGWQPLVVYSVDESGNLDSVTFADALGRFELKVNKPRVKIYAWLDFDGDAKPSYGDLLGYYGYAGGKPRDDLAQTLVLSMNEVKLIDLNIAPIVEASFTLSLSVQDLEKLVNFKNQIMNEHYKKLRDDR